jgi:hypothetical protein
MTRKEKIEYIYELAAAKEVFFYSLLTLDELNQIIEVLRKYDDPINWDTVAPEDLQVLEAIEKNHDERVNQLTPEEIETIRLDDKCRGGFEVARAAYGIKVRLGIINGN